MRIGKHLLAALCAPPLAVAVTARGPDAPPFASAPATPAFAAMLAFARDQGTTGLLIVRDGAVVARADWPTPVDDARFVRMLTYGTAADGSLREDVASQQKSLVAILAGIAADRGRLDVDRQVSTYLGTGWSKASPAQEARITVLHLLTMSSGLDADRRYRAAPGTTFAYDTALYALMKPVLERATGQPLDRITDAWLTGPLGMTETRWRRRPNDGGATGNATALVTTPADLARLGQMVLDDGRNRDGRQVISRTQLAAILRPSAANPAYGRLWWLNAPSGGIAASGARRPGRLIPAAPADAVMALGTGERLLFVVPGQRLVVVRTGRMPTGRGFANRLWQLLVAALPPRRAQPAT